MPTTARVGRVFTCCDPALRHSSDLGTVGHNSIKFILNPSKVMQHMSFSVEDLENKFYKSFDCVHETIYITLKIYVFGKF